MPLQLKCIIVDDEPLARELLKSYVEKTPTLILEEVCESATEAYKALSEKKIDIIFLDINMPMLNGIEFAGLIPKRTRIIYVTAYEQYAVQGFRVNALDYLLKPVSYQEFLSSIGKAVEWFSRQTPAAVESVSESDTITVKSDYRLHRIRLQNIRYIEVQKDRLIFYRTDKDPLSSIMSMKEIEELLPEDSFMRVHRSFIVNMRHVEIMEKGRIVFDKTYIPISESKREEFLSRLNS
ncbi:MAG: LytTR family DNA-binding domain-containing protein [Muribaculaceae bacterium]|mgnify:FL=1